MIRIGEFRVLALVLLAALCAAVQAQQRTPSTVPLNENPVGYGIAWTNDLHWGNVLNINDVPGADWDARLAAAQAQLAAQGGGVVYFPAGTYAFAETVKLKNGIVLRGENPAKLWDERYTWDARDAEYTLPSKILFPQYRPIFTGEGTPNDTAFKGIELEDQVGGHDCGVVNLDINHGHIALGSSDNYAQNIAEGRCGKNLLVYGSIVRNAAIPDPAIPMPHQEKWQRWTQRHFAAVRIFTGGNVLVANNRIPRSGEDSFVMKGYKLYNETNESIGLKEPGKLKVLTADVLFDYDNRPGIAVNAVSAGKELQIWNDYTGGPTPSPQPGPHALTRGIVIRNNYVYCTGGYAINTTGDGAVVSFNVIRFEPNVIRITARGYQYDYFTNNNRAIELRGYRWTVEGNDYEVYSNLTADGKRRYGDGEGIMHESWNNCGIIDSRLINNKGNRYLCLWRVPIDGLEIRGNQVPYIYVLSVTNKEVPLPCRNVRILDNTTYVSPGIRVKGTPDARTIIKDNRHTEPYGTLLNTANAKMEGNEGYTLTDK